MIRLWCTQVLAIVRLEMKKTFFSRRGLWVYLLAFASLLLFAVHSIEVAHRQDQLRRIVRDHPISREDLIAIQGGMTCDEVTQKLGEPYSQRRWHGRDEHNERTEQSRCRYTDGNIDVHLFFENGKL